MPKRKNGNHEPLFNAEQVRQIREYFEWRRRGKTQAQLAKLHGCTQSTIGKVVNYLPPYDKKPKKRKAKPP